MILCDRSAILPGYKILDARATASQSRAPPFAACAEAFARRAFSVLSSSNI